MRGVEGRAGAPVPVIWLHHPGVTPLQLPPVTQLSHHQAHRGGSLLHRLNRRRLQSPKT